MNLYDAAASTTKLRKLFQVLIVRLNLRKSYLGPAGFKFKI